MTLRVSLLALLIGCDDDVRSNQVNKDEGFEEEVDEDPPLIEHTPVTETQTFGVDVPVSATVTDEASTVLFVYLHYKNVTDGDQDWKQLLMPPSGTVYSGAIKGTDMHSSGIDYYLEAVDSSQNIAYAPEDGPDDPYTFRVAE